MSSRGWKVNSAILLGSEHPVLCAKWWIRCCLYEAVLSKIPLQLLHLKAIDCCPECPPGWMLPLFDLLMIVRSQADRSNEHSRNAQNDPPKLADTDNTKINTTLFISTRIRQSTKLEVFDIFDYCMALEDKILTKFWRTSSIRPR